MGGAATIFGIGLNTSKTASSILASQSSVVIALDRLDYEGRCASQAALVSSGRRRDAYVPQPVHARDGNRHVVRDGRLARPLQRLGVLRQRPDAHHDVTSTTPFSCVVPVGNYPAVQAALTVNTGTTSATASSGTDTITLENAALTTSTTAACT